MNAHFKDGNNVESVHALALYVTFADTELVQGTPNLSGACITRNHAKVFALLRSMRTRKLRPDVLSSAQVQESISSGDLYAGHQLQYGYRCV